MTPEVESRKVLQDTPAAKTPMLWTPPNSGHAETRRDLLNDKWPIHVDQCWRIHRTGAEHLILPGVTGNARLALARERQRRFGCPITLTLTPWKMRRGYVPIDAWERATEQVQIISEYASAWRQEHDIGAILVITETDEDAWIIDKWGRGWQYVADRAEESLYRDRLVYSMLRDWWPAANIMFYNRGMMFHGNPFPWVHPKLPGPPGCSLFRREIVDNVQILNETSADWSLVYPWVMMGNARHTDGQWEPLLSEQTDHHYRSIGKFVSRCRPVVNSEFSPLEPYSCRNLKGLVEGAV